MYTIILILIIINNSDNNNWCILTVYSLLYTYTVDPLIKDPPSNGHDRNNLSTKDIFRVPNVHFPILFIHSEPLKSRQNLYKGQNGWPQCVLCLEVPLYSYVYIMYTGIINPLL